MEIDALVDKYFDQIQIESIDYVPMDAEAPCPVGAYIELIIPVAMLREYAMLKNSSDRLPDGVEFWRTCLQERLRNSGKDSGHFNESLKDILDLLEGPVSAQYSTGNKERISLTITEIPELY